VDMIQGLALVDTVTVLDERWELVNLTSNVRVSGIFPFISPYVCMRA
jgi:hypothetical protein